MSGNDAYTKSLLHLNSDFADVAAGGTHTWTGYGNAQIDAAVKKFGAGSLLVDGLGDYIDTPDSDDWSMGSGDFTLDFWFKRARAQFATEMLCGNADSTGNNFNAGFGAFLPSVPIDGYTKALLHFNGNDNSTVFTDTGPQFVPNIWTPHGDAKLSTTSPKFGSAAGIFDGTGDWIDTPAGTLWDMGSGDFTIDFWLKRGAIGTAQWVTGQCNSEGSNNSISFLVRFNANNTIGFAVASGENWYEAISTGTITDTTTWHHIACIRDGNTTRLFIDGSADGTANVTGVSINSSIYTLSIGRCGAYAGNYLNGRIDEFRILKGQAYYISNFTPPTSEYIYNRIWFWICVGGIGYGALSTTDISDIDTWHHFAGVRHGSDLLLFLDGILEATTAVGSASVNNSAYKYAFGREGEVNYAYFKGNIDETRISKGIARWTTNFTPPTDEYNGWEPPSGVSFVAWID